MKKLVSLSIAISDISVSAALIERTAEKKSGLESARPVIKTFRTKTINPEQSDITSQYLEERLRPLLRSVIGDARHEDVAKCGYTIRDIKKVTVSLSAPWFEGKTVISHFKEAKQFKVTDQLMKKALDSEIKAISGADRQQITVLESTILSSTLNGYTITNPIGKMATALTVYGYVSYARTSIKDMIVDIVDSFFHEAGEVLIKSEPTILLSAAIKEARIAKFDEDFAIIRVNEILTHIQIVKNEHIRELGTVPIGLNTILTDISTSCNVTHEVALNVIKLYVERKLETQFSARVQQIVEGALEKWRAAIKTFSTSTIASGRFPSHVFLSSPSIISHVLEDYLKKDNYLDLTMSEKNLKINILDRSTLNEFVTIDPSVKVEPGFLTKLNSML